MNYMEQVAKILGVEIGEEFEIVGQPIYFNLTNYGLFDKNENFYSRLLVGLLSGQCNIKKIPWKPEEEQEYCYVDLNGNIDKEVWLSSFTKDVLNYKLGNCFKTEKEITPEIIKKYTDFFNDDERMIDI